MNLEDIKVPDSVIKKLVDVLDNDRINNEVENLKSILNSINSKSFLINNIIKKDKEMVYEQIVKDFEQKIISVKQDPEFVKQQVQGKLYTLYKALEVCMSSPLKFSASNDYNGISISTTNFQLSKYNDQIYFYVNIDGYGPFMSQTFICTEEKIICDKKLEINKDILENIKPAYNSNYKEFKKLFEESKILNLFKSLILFNSYEKIFTADEIKLARGYGASSSAIKNKIEGYKKVLMEHFENLEFSDFESLEREYNDFIEISKLQYDIDFPKIDNSNIKTMTLEFNK